MEARDTVYTEEERNAEPGEVAATPGEPSQQPPAFEDLGLSEALLDGVRRRGYTTPTPVQAQAVPPGLAGRDVLGCAQTGTGKTAAFVLPMLQRLAEHPDRHGVLRGLIVTPTRELARQVERAVAHYGAVLSIEPLVIYGGVSIDAQRRDLEWGCDVVVATPGRLLDHLRRGNIDLGQVEVLVLDEADRMLDMGFIDDVRAIVRATPRERQTFLFSATIPDRILSLAHEMMRDPVRIQVGRQTRAEGIEEVIHPVDHAEKHGLCLRLLRGFEGQALVFTRMKSTAAYLRGFLEREGVSVDELHGDRSQAERERSLQRFRDAETRVLVATNVAARGLDIRGITHVINYDVPDDPDDYVHRVGRTARGDETGDAITLMSPHEWLLVRNVEIRLGHPIRRAEVEGFEPSLEPPAPFVDDPEEEERKPRSRLTRGRRSR